MPDPDRPEPSAPSYHDTSEPHRVCVFAPMLHLTMTIEAGEAPSEGVQSASKDGDGTDDIHVHPGGQGFWIARMLRTLGEEPVLVGTVGGEIGQVLNGLVPAWGIESALVEVETPSPGYIHDRRSGKRETLADQAARRLDRHEIDELYGKVLEVAIAAGACVMTSAPTVGADVYKRLGADLASSGVRVIGDFHGEGLVAFLEGGPIELLKVSHEDLASDGWEVGDETAVIAALERLGEMGAQDVVISRADQPAMAHISGTVYQAAPPALEVVDHMGAGDSMTAGLAAARLRGLGPADALKLASAAGAANVTRHGLGSGSADLIAALADQVDVAEFGADVAEAGA